MDFSSEGNPFVDIELLLHGNLEVQSENISMPLSSEKTGGIESTELDLQFGQKLTIVSGKYRADDDSVHEVSTLEVNGNNLTIILPCIMGAWGSGKHPTTQLCCKQLFACSQLIKGRRGLDFGCGSAVLSILSAKLGCSHVIGVDIEPSSVDGSYRNAAANGIDPAIFNFYLPPKEFIQKDLDFFCRFGEWSKFSSQLLPDDEVEFDLIVANILPGPLTRLAPLLCRLCRHGGEIMLAGIRRFQAAALADAYAACGVDLTPVDALLDESGEEWVLLRGRKPSDRGSDPTS